MVWTEKKCHDETTLKKIESEFSSVFPSETQNGMNIYFVGGNDTAHIVTLKMPDEDECFFVIEYGSGDDGDAFYLSDYNDLNAMIKDMIEEAKNG